MEDKKINFQKLREIMRDARLKPLEKCVFVDLLLYAGTNRDAYPSEKTLAEDFNVSDRHIRNVLNQLKNKGLLDWKRRGFSRSNKYDLIREIYFLNDENSKNQLGNHVSFYRGKPFPLQTRTSFPPNVSQERNQLKKVICENCQKNDCLNGWIFINNNARRCQCQLCHETK